MSGSAVEALAPGEQTITHRRQNAAPTPCLLSLCHNPPNPQSPQRFCPGGLRSGTQQRHATTVRDVCWSSPVTPRTRDPDPAKHDSTSQPAKSGQES